jgi:hypothetical protein
MTVAMTATIAAARWTRLLVQNGRSAEISWGAEEPGGAAAIGLHRSGLARTQHANICS